LIISHNQSIALAVANAQALKNLDEKEENKTLIMDNYHVYDQGFDFGSFINFPEDSNMESNNMDLQFPTEDVSADLSFSDMQLIPDMDFSQYAASVNTFDTFEYPASSVNESPLITN
jgi:hypothetical protein